MNCPICKADMVMDCKIKIETSLLFSMDATRKM